MCSEIIDKTQAHTAPSGVVANLFCQVVEDLHSEMRGDSRSFMEILKNVLGFLENGTASLSLVSNFHLFGGLP